MGMAPTKPHAGILELLEEAEAVIHLRKQNGKKCYASLETIQNLKHRLNWSDKSFENLLVDGLSVGFLLGMTAQGPENPRMEKIVEDWNKFFNKKKITTPDEKRPGRKDSEITRAMKTLLAVIPTPMPYAYNREQFINDLIVHKASLKDIIKPVKESDSHIQPCKPGEKSATIESARDKLMKLAK